MKTKLLILLASVLFQNFSAQCYIEGKSEISVGETAIYAIANNTAKCTDCHQWSVMDKNSSIQSDSLKSSIQLKALSGGITILTLTGTSDKGPFQCSKTITVSAQVPQNLNTENPNCDIKSALFTEQRNGDTLTLVPTVRNESFFYTWTFVKPGEDPVTSKEQAPVINLTENNHSKINEIRLRIHSNKCMRTVNKTYPNGL